MAENNYPTIRDLRDRANELIERGFSELPIQVVIAPDSTMQALARGVDGFDPSKPALMIEFPCEGPRIGVSFISTARLSGDGGMKTLLRQ